MIRKRGHSEVDVDGGRGIGVGLLGERREGEQRLALLVLLLVLV